MKKLSVILALLLVFALVLTACGKKDPTPTNGTEPPKTENTEPSKEATEPSKPAVEPAVYDSIKDFNYDEGQSGVWQYFFSGDNGETFDPCGGYHDYGGGIRGWHPWEGSYIGVGFNDDVPDFLELNTDGHSSDFSNQMGVLAFVAPADGKYVLTAAVWNPWSQNCEKFTFKHNDTVIYEQDMTDLIDVYGYITPTDVEMKAGDVIYMYLNSVDSSWVSGYINAVVYYEPQDDSVYEVPEVTVPEKPEVFVPSNDDALYNAANQFDTSAADGSNVPWVYGSTFDGNTFATSVRFEDNEEWNLHQWYSEGGTGCGVNGSVVEGWLEVNATDVEGEMTAIGFKAPEAGTYVISGYTFNPGDWGQNPGSVHVVLNGEEIETLNIGGEATEFSFEVTLGAGEVAYFYCNSEGGWVSAYLAIYVNAK